MGGRQRLARGLTAIRQVPDPVAETAVCGLRLANGFNSQTNKAWFDVISINMALQIKNNALFPLFKALKNKAFFVKALLRRYLWKHKALYFIFKW